MSRCPIPRCPFMPVRPRYEEPSRTRAICGALSCMRFPFCRTINPMSKSPMLNPMSASNLLSADPLRGAC